MDSRRIDIVGCDDCEAVYADGALVADGHSVRVGDVLESLGFDVHRKCMPGENALEAHGFSFPKNLDDLTEVRRG